MQQSPNGSLNGTHLLVLFHELSRVFVRHILQIVDVDRLCCRCDSLCLQQCIFQRR
jgi:hypothetical protein